MWPVFFFFFKQINYQGDESLSPHILFLLLLPFSSGTYWASWTNRNRCEYKKKKSLICPFNVNPHSVFCHKTGRLSTTDLIPPWGCTSFDSETDTVASVENHTSNFLTTKPTAVHQPVLLSKISPLSCFLFRFGAPRDSLWPDCVCCVWTLCNVI